MRDRPWMTALEMQFLAVRIQRAIIAADAPPSVTDQFVSDYLHRCVPFAWSEETSSAVWTASRTIPMDVVIDVDVVPEPACWWWFDCPLPIPMRDPNGRPEGFDARNIYGFMIVVQPPVITICDARIQEGLGPLLVGLSAFRIGTTLAENLSGESFTLSDTGMSVPNGQSARALSIVRFILAAGVWLRQRIVSISSGHIERHARKSIARDFGAHIADVNVVQLRRHESSRLGDKDVADSVDWSCRWLVSGHWRNQPYKDGHRLKYILPYVKGPADKPLKVTSQTVYSVRK